MFNDTSKAQDGRLTRGANPIEVDLSGDLPMYGAPIRAPTDVANTSAMLLHSARHPVY